MQYVKYCAPTEKWVLKHGSQPVNLQAKVAELDIYHDRVVVFEAVEISNESHLPSRRPLQPTNTQVLSPPDKSSHSQKSVNDKMPISAPQKLIPRPLDENSMFQPKPYLLQAHTECSQPPTDVRSFANTPSPIKSHHPAPNVSQRSSFALPMGSPSPLSKVPCPATHIDSPARQVPTSMRPSNMLTSPPGLDTTQLGPVQSSSYSNAKPPNNSVSNEPPITPVEVDDEHQKTFQLQTLLKDTTPQMLEASVEQGVKLLDRLKGVMVEKLQSTVDAEQWMQQVGKWLSRSFSADLDLNSNTR